MYDIDKKFLYLNSGYFGQIWTLRATCLLLFYIFNCESVEKLIRKPDHCINYGFKCGPWDRGVSIPWGPVRNADSQAPPLPTRPRLWPGKGPRARQVDVPSAWFQCSSSWGSTGLRSLHEWEGASYISYESRRCHTFLGTDWHSSHLEKVKALDKY